MNVPLATKLLSSPTREFSADGQLLDVLQWGADTPAAVLSAKAHDPESGNHRLRRRQTGSRDD